MQGDMRKCDVSAMLAVCTCRNQYVGHSGAFRNFVVVRARRSGKRLKKNEGSLWGSNSGQQLEETAVL